MARLESLKQEQYLLNLISGMSQRQAYRAAYPNCKSPDKIVDEKASKLLSQDKVRARYDELRGKAMQPLEDKALVTAQRIREELAKVAFSSGADFAQVLPGGIVEICPTGDLPAEKRAAIAAIEETREGVKVKTYDKLKALELLGKDLGMFGDRLAVMDETPDPFRQLTADELKAYIKLRAKETGPDG